MSRAVLFLEVLIAPPLLYAMVQSEVTSWVVLAVAAALIVVAVLMLAQQGQQSTGKRRQKHSAGRGDEAS